MRMGPGAANVPQRATASVSILHQGGRRIDHMPRPGNERARPAIDRHLTTRLSDTAAIGWRALERSPARLAAMAGPAGGQRWQRGR
jgi:hypothetical protein